MGFAVYGRNRCRMSGLLPQASKEGLAMKSEPTFLIGEHGQAVIEVIGGPHQENFKCCDQPMGLLLANTTDGAKEKHLPKVKVKGNKVTVKVGENPHPMTGEHNIQWIYLQTEKGCQRRMLEPDKPAEAEFLVADDDKPVAVYSHCNLHGFWKTSL